MKNSSKKPLLLSGNGHFNAARTLAIAARHKHHDHTHGATVLSRGSCLGKLATLLGSHLFADCRAISGGSDYEIGLLRRSYRQGTGIDRQQANTNREKRENFECRILFHHAALYSAPQLNDA